MQKFTLFSAASVVVIGIANPVSAQDGRDEQPDASPHNLNANFRPEEPQESYMMSAAYLTGEFRDVALTATLFANSLGDEEVLQRAGTLPILDMPVGKLAPPRGGLLVGYHF